MTGDTFKSLNFVHRAGQPIKNANVLQDLIKYSLSNAKYNKPGIDEKATGCFFYYCFPPYVTISFQKKKIVKSQKSGNFGNEKDS